MVEKTWKVKVSSTGGKYEKKNVENSKSPVQWGNVKKREKRKVSSTGEKYEKKKTWKIQSLQYRLREMLRKKNAVMSRKITHVELRGHLILLISLHMKFFIYGPPQARIFKGYLKFGKFKLISLFN